MTEHYRFFNSTAEDVREYLASEFAEYFSRFLSDGLYTEDGQAGLQVSAGEGLQVSIEAGYAFVRGYMYHNDVALTKDLQAADANLNRIDRVVLRFDEVARTILLAVKTGAVASSPVPPALEITDTVKELALAQVYVKAGATTITSVTDERLTENCGLVSSLIDIPAGEMWEQWLRMMNDIEAAWLAQTTGIDEDWDDLTTLINAEWDAQTSAIANEWNTHKTAWESWFESLAYAAGNRLYVGEEEPAELEIGDFWVKVIV